MKPLKIIDYEGKGKRNIQYIHVPSWIEIVMENGFTIATYTCHWKGDLRYDKDRQDLFEEIKKEANNPYYPPKKEK